MVNQQAPFQWRDGCEVCNLKHLVLLISQQSHLDSHPMSLWWICFQERELQIHRQRGASKRVRERQRARAREEGE